MVSIPDAVADELFLRTQKIQAIKRPTERSQSNLSNLISNTQSLVSDESDWIRHGPDLAALGRGSEHGWLNTFLEDLLNKISMRLTVASVPCLADSNRYAYLPTHLLPTQLSLQCLFSNLLFTNNDVMTSPNEVT